MDNLGKIDLTTRKRNNVISTVCTPHLLSIECAGWPKQHEMSEARDVTIRLDRFPVRSFVIVSFLSTLIQDAVTKVVLIRSYGPGKTVLSRAEALAIFSRHSNESTPRHCYIKLGYTALKSESCHNINFVVTLGIVAVVITTTSDAMSDGKLTS